MKKKYLLLCLVINFIPIISIATVTTDNKLWNGVIIYSNFFTMGSGVPISKCHILTNHHVVKNDKTAYVVINNEQFPAHIVDTDPNNDLILLKVDSCPITQYASLSKSPPNEGDILTLVYYKPGFNFFNTIIKTKGKLKWFSDIVTDNGKDMNSIVIDDPHPNLRSSGGGVSSQNGLVSIIFGISNQFSRPATYGVSYEALKAFMQRNQYALIESK